MKKVTGENNIAMEHFSTLSYVLAGFIGSQFGNKKNSTEDLNLPKSLFFLRDTTVAIAFTMSIIFLITCLFAGNDLVKELSGGKIGLFFPLCSPSFLPPVSTLFYKVCKWSSLKLFLHLKGFLKN